METGNNMDNNQENQISNLENKRKERHGILGIFYLVKGIFSVVLGAIPLVLVVMGLTGKLDETAAKLFPETFGNKHSYRAINTEEREQEDVPDEISQKKPIEESSGESVVVDNYTLDAIPKSSKDYGKYLHLGETYTNGDGDITMEIIDIGYQSDSGVITDDVTWGYTNVYIAIEVTNNSNSDIYFDQSNAILFIDDYEADKGSSVEVFQQNGYFIYDGTNSYPTVANVRSGGRKGIIGFIAMFTKNSGVAETSDIEFEVCGLVFKINPSFIVRELTSETATSNSGGIGNPIIDSNPDRYVLEDGCIDGIVYGTYLLSPNGVGGYSDAVVGFSSYDSEDYVSIDSYGDDGGYSFTGYFHIDGDSYVATDKYDVSYRITFTNDGMNVEMITGTPDDYDETFIGNYKLIDKLDLDAVS